MEPVKAAIKQKRVTFSVTMDRSIRDRLDAVVKSIKAADRGVRTSRLALVEAVVVGKTTLPELEATWLPKKEQEKRKAGYHSQREGLQS